MESMDVYLSDSVGFAMLRKAGGPRAVGDQCAHDRGGRIGGYWDAGGEERSGASAERRIATGTSRIWSNTAANSCLARITSKARRPAMA